MSSQVENNMYLSPVSTSGVQTVTAMEFELEQNSSQNLEVIVVGKAGSGAKYGGRRYATVERDTGDASVVAQSAGPINASVALATAGIVFDNSGSSILVRITGVVLQDVEWWAVINRVALWDD